MGDLGQPLRDFLGETEIRNIVELLEQDYKTFQAMSHEDEVKKILLKY